MWLADARAQELAPRVVAQSSNSTAAVKLGRPSAAHSGLVPTSFTPETTRNPSVVVRAQSGEPPQPMPVGTAPQTPELQKGPPLADTPGGVKPAPIATSPNAPPPPLGAGQVPGTGLSTSPPAVYDPAPPPGVPFAGEPWRGCAGPFCEDPCAPACTAANPCWWFRGEYLLWNINDSNTPPLVTTSPPTSLGVIGQPGTQVLFGGPIDHKEFSGGRFTFGFWLDQCEKCGVEANFFFLGERAVNFSQSSLGLPLLARPFFNVDPANPGEDAELVANPLVPEIPSLLPLAGTIDVRLDSELWGTDVNWIINKWQYCCGRTDFLVGLRYMRLRESIDITENLLVPPNSPAFAGTQIFLNDHFATRNWFFGGQLGLRQTFNWRNWQIDMTGKCALGSTQQRVNIDGATIITPPGGAPNAFTGALLAQPTNIGEYSRSVFSVIPEAGINIGYHVTPNWKLFVGYTLIYWSNVARPGDQIDRVVNGTQIAPRVGPFVGPPRPVFPFADTDFWAHGVNFGVELKW
jgi:hypothetical protein